MKNKFTPKLRKAHSLGFIIGVIIALLGLGFFLFNSPVLAQDQPAPAAELDTLFKSADANFQKHAGLLPSSPFYFFKSAKEGIVGWFKFGDKKTAYWIGLNQKRLTESYLVIQKNKPKTAQKALKSYTKLATQIQKRDFQNFQSELSNQYVALTLLKKMDTSQTLAGSFDPALTQTLRLLQIIARQNTQLQDWVQGKVLEKNENSIVVEWRDQKVRFLDMDKAKFVDQDGNETKQSFKDVTVNAVVAVAPLQGRLNMQTVGQEKLGIASAEKVMIIGQ